MDAGIVGGVIGLVLLTIFFFLIHSGLFHKVKVGAGLPPVGGITVAYKFARGPYKNVGYIFKEASTISEKRLKTFGVYYDDPREVPAKNLRAAIGCILSEGETASDEKLKAAFLRHKYRLFTFPAITSAVCATFPFTTTLSIIISTMKVYPALSAYIEEHKLCGHPFLEIFHNEEINFMVPLAKQDEFYVPETEGKKSKEEWKSPMNADSASETVKVSKHDALKDESKDTLKTHGD